MSGDDITNSVYPYKKILPKSLKNDIVNYFMASSYRPKSLILAPRANKKYSTIISTRHVSLIEGWISHDTASQLSQQKSVRPSFSWNLLYRATEDGFNAVDFHRKCDNKGACVVIVKIKDSDKIVGGYNPVGWMLPNGYTATDKSFLFYFDNSTSKISRILPDCSVSAIFQNSSYGPTFGYPDLFISSNCNQTNSSDCNCNHYYEKNFSVTDFFVEDYEVFQIISKN
ncbi:TLD-domain-containing protein [Gigaspora rosea]|uniref:TLD-domain-containing protein n=1 Tax=Gigaspora rosea TaxID=44941 RepID=A0A397U470_9GLOM|nr:TLD-domain-containing protein [Gigaspora rosea]